MESKNRMTWDDCQNEDCLKFIAKCRFGNLKRKQMKEETEEEARRQKALKREFEARRAERLREQKKMAARRLNGRKVVDRCKQIGFELTEEQKEAFLAGSLVRDVFSVEERRQYRSLCHRK